MSKENKSAKKKTFFKRKYNYKHKVKEWEQKRHKYIINKYNKELRRQNIDVNTSTVNQRFLSESGSRLSELNKAKLEYEKRKAEKKQLSELKLKKKQEMEEALKLYKMKKAEKFKKLSRKTKKGQPVMKDRLELLYEEIKQKFGQND